ncbi:hypothetical protein BST41_18525 [Mycolicibacterium porcinum]|nr:hypothetical protein BST41_18525 [Mycolicibacterium porcinum]
MAAAGLVVAAPAAADTQSYLQKIHDAGINPPRGDLELKEWGWEICAMFLRGRSPVDVVRQTVYNSGSKPLHDMSEQQANLIVDTAVSDLCPDRDGGWDR